jgi:hypothetical protein
MLYAAQLQEFWYNPWSPLPKDNANFFAYLAALESHTILRLSDDVGEHERLQ